MIAKRRILVSTIDDQQLMRDWASLWEESPLANYTNSPAWLRAGLAAFQNERHYIVAVYRGIRLDAVVAVVSERRYGVNCLVRPGKFNCGTPFLIRSSLASKSVLSDLTRHIMNLGTLVLNDMPLEIKLAVVKSHRHAIAHNGGHNLGCLVNQSTSDMLKTQGLSDLRRIKHKLDEFRFIFNAPHDPNTINTIISIDDKSSKSEAGYSTFSDLATRNFFVNLVSLYKQHVILNYLHHQSQSEPIAYEIGFIVQDTYYGNQTAFNKAFKQYSPGKLLAYELLTKLSQTKIHKIDFGSGDNGVKQKLANYNDQLYHVVASHNLLLVYYLSYIRRLQDWAYRNLVNHALYKRYRKLKTTLLRSKKL